MRRTFFKLLHQKMAEDERIIVLTGDMGYGLLNQIRDSYPNRFFNVGSAEQLLIGSASGVAMENKIPVCYSITPFLLYRPFEFIRNYMGHEKLPIKLVGGGRGDDYGYLGYTHHDFLDIKMLSNLPEIELFKPMTDEDMMNLVHPFLFNGRPSYINLVK
jgi:transketolase